MRTVTAGLVAGLLIASPVTALTTAEASTSDVVVFDSGGHIWRMDSDGTNATDLTSGWGGFAADPSLSPDGSTVVFEYGTGSPSSSELYTIPAAGAAFGAATRLTTNSVADLDPAWSPDGTKIAFTRDVPTNANPRNYEIFVMALPAGTTTRLTNDTLGDYDTDPAWSPSGASLAFTTTKDHFGCYDEGSGIFIGFSQVHTMSSSGGATSNVIDRSWLSSAAPDWSPNGSSIAFYGTEYSIGPDTGNGPTCVSHKSSVIYTITFNGATPTLSYLVPGIWPSWSPDGTRLAYSDETSQAVKTVEIATKTVTPLNVTGRFVDWVAPSSAIIDTTITVTVTSGTKLKASGTVTPNLSGQTVRVVLYRKANGSFSKVAARSSVLDATSAYSARFDHPAAGTCKVKATYAGDSTHAASSASVIIPC